MITLLIRESDLTEYTSLNSNLDADKVKPYVFLSQKYNLKKVLGSTLFNKIYEDFTNDNLSGIYETIYNDFVVEILAFDSCAKFLTFGAYRTGNNGTNKPAPDNADAVNFSELSRLSKEYKNLSVSAENAFFDFMKENDLPEWNASKKNEEKDSNKIIPWF